MRSTICNFSCKRTVAACLAVFALASQGQAAEIRDCRSIEDNAERLACYDGLSSPPSPTPAPPEAAAKRVEISAEPVETPTPTTESTAAEPAVLDDSIGKERIADRRGEEADLIVTGHVTSCREDRSGKYRFYFENGQIWLQKDNKKISWRECDFDVTIEKDFFGYKMLPHGEKRTIRISRIQ